MVRESWMLDHGLNNVIELIKRQKWGKLFKRREFVHVDTVKEFYARLTLIHYKKKEVARYSVRGVEIEFDHMKLTSILGIPGNNGICEYIKDVWEESKYIKPIEITGKRRDYEDVAPVEEVNEDEEQNRSDFDWEEVVDEAALQGESGSDDQFFDAQVDVEEPVTEAPAVPVFPSSRGDSTNEQKEPATAGVDPSTPIGSILDAIFSSLQADFERARANRIQANLERAQAENARLLALLQQAKSQLKP
ncbi:hypothetical protein Dimus_007706 [Dionaea muscipula]